ncbi:unnamed protein product [Rotaria magnacalcarata]|uniref:Uncharacterized protein n=1 Tax=Rotaria magnacalcarata TaxID=392030 RepID=A0A819PSN8_9BILA|nr:unnamed protein product [Rotaria magnacalcarata]CAF4015666.1 unnamed protein product [Rotaria magnacalcarata]
MSHSDHNQNRKNSSDRSSSGQNYPFASFRPNGGRQSSWGSTASNSGVLGTVPNRNNSSSTTQKTKNKYGKNSYVVNLLLKPVEMGILAKNENFQQEFKGLGAFNHYFGLLAPTNNMGYTLPDVWDGYFHITLAEFSTSLQPDKIEDAFIEFKPDLKDLPQIPDVIFQATSLYACSGANRSEDRKDIDFVVLGIDSTNQTKDFYERLRPILEKIGKHTESNDLTITKLNELHVTIRKYSNFQQDLSKIQVEKFPIQFSCAHLEVKQAREQARDRFKWSRRNSRIYRWWTGVTEIDRKCSGCGEAIMSEKWEGFCLLCGKYESIIPIWSTDGKSNAHYQQILQEEEQKNPSFN